MKTWQILLEEMRRYLPDVTLRELKQALAKIMVLDQIADAIEEERRNQRTVTTK